MAKKYIFRLTEKQYEAIRTAVFEHGEVEKDSETGKPIARYMEKIGQSLYEQLEKQKVENGKK